MLRFSKLTIWFLLLIALAAPGAFAQDEPAEDVVEDVEAVTDDIGFYGWGPRAGFTVSPDQFHVGVHFDLGNFAERIRFVPNAEIGFGDDITLFAANLNVTFRFDNDWNEWSPYVGSGVGAVVASRNDDPNDPLSSKTDFNAGVNLIGGIDRQLDSGNRFLLEGKVGFGDIPDFKLALGWTFMQ